MKVSALKLGAILVVGAAFFFVGYQYATAVYGKDIAELREDYATRSQALEVKYREKEREQYNSLVLAWEERDKAIARVNDLSRDVDRVRGEADAARRRLSSAGAATCATERKQLARSAELLERCGCLLERGVKLSSRTAIDKDAIVRIVQ